MKVISTWFAFDVGSGRGGSVQKYANGKALSIWWNRRAERSGYGLDVLC